MCRVVGVLALGVEGLGYSTCVAPSMPAPVSSIQAAHACMLSRARWDDALEAGMHSAQAMLGGHCQWCNNPVRLQGRAGFCWQDTAFGGP